MGETHPISSPQASFEPHISPINSSLIPSGFTPAQKWSLFPSCDVLFQATSGTQAQRHSPAQTPLPTQTQIPPILAATTYTVPCENEASATYITENNLQTNYLAQNQQQSAQSLPPRKRAPKSQTMSAKRWRPCEARLKQLYVHDGKSLRELCEIVNSEFGLTATENQYKSKIKKLGLKRNVEEKDQKAVVRCILHRIHAVGKNSSHVRIRGHKMAPEKISRWMKNVVTDRPMAGVLPPSPLPSYISVYTTSPCVSPKLASTDLSDNRVQGLRSMSPNDMDTTVMQRLLKYARRSKHTIECQEARAVFNDLQLILGCKPDTGKKYQDAWNPNVEEDLIRIRNLMNMTHEIRLNESGSEAQQSSPALQIQNLATQPSRCSHRHASWMTPHGRVEASFWTISNRPSGRFSPDVAIAPSGRELAARVVLNPIDPEKCSTRVVFDFTPHLYLSANISYQAMILNDSEVFEIVASGQVRTLIETLEKGAASLTDRDQQGRSLLSYAIFNRRPDMCKFLVDQKADVNAIESHHLDVEFIGPVHGGINSLDSEYEEPERLGRAECMKIMLQAEADFSLETYEGDGVWRNTFMNAVSGGSFAVFKHIVDFGEPFISLNGTYNSGYRQRTPLMWLATSCGYDMGEAIDIVEKAILLLQRGADISCRDNDGDTVLHTLLACDRYHERISESEALKRNFMGLTLKSWRLSITEPLELLKAFITAGADVYATNDKGETPSLFAWDYGREEWIEALDFCGYDTEQVLAHAERGLHECSCDRQSSKLSFQEFCQQRRGNARFEEVDTDDEDDSSGGEEDEGSDEDGDEDEVGSGEDDNSENEQPFGVPQCHELLARESERRGASPEGYCGVEHPDPDTNVGFEDTWETPEDELMEEVDDHAVEPDQTMQRSFERMDLDFESLNGNETDILEDFFDFGGYADA